MSEKKKSQYKGVHQRKNGTWYYRIKKTFEDGTIEHFQESGFKNEELANQARIERLRSVESLRGFSVILSKEDIVEITFGVAFQEFLNDGFIESENSIKKYQALYNAQLMMWEHREIHTLTDQDIDILLLRLSLQGYSESYISSIRKLLKIFFGYLNLTYPMIDASLGTGIVTKPYKLRVLSLFTGIGAFEQALTNLKIDYQLVNFCEINEKAIKAYCLLHNAIPDKNLGNINTAWYKHYIPNADIMFFGFPCTSISRAGKREGLRDGDGELTESGLFFSAMRVAYLKKPKILIAENVADLLGKKHKEDFKRIIEEFEDRGYNYFYRKLNARDFGLPQNRERVFFILVREDLELRFKFPKGFPSATRAEDYFLYQEENKGYTVDDKCYVDMSKDTKLSELLRTGYDFEKQKEYIKCITTGWGYRSYDRQSFIKDDEGIRCLDGQELMRFQGFTYEQGKLLRENGFTNSEIGYLVGNSISVPILERIMKKLIEALGQNNKVSIPDKEQRKYKWVEIMPLFSYSGNKTKLLQYLLPLFPKDLPNMNFIDAFAGTATVSVNIKAKRILVNDFELLLINIYKALSTIPPEEAWEQVVNVVDWYNLSSEDEQGYIQCKEHYNRSSREASSVLWAMGLALIYHSFNRGTIRHNLEGEYNASFGENKCDMGISKMRFFPFAKKLYESNHFEFSNKDFRELPLEEYGYEDTFIYLDPPYYASEATYNKGWTEKDERELYAFLEDCDKKGIRWMLSNVTENNAKRNEILIEWLEKVQDKFHIYHLNRDYKNSNYQRENKGKTDEIVVTNYKD
ncbi:Dam family site-specific DNA-(adenine-N6)-methyltransferase [Sedimentibacter hydroxybenzoicus DSM 7310]|uniref:site-specific DNA-methyltransferase (adenine-specific) n=1 Tax=Sedimentibacter hydroxybenzoicus DSM 7310 TaxID=1123245 RepID=A0A974BIZ7_SEDHY|nr:Dam family site-specific DNA-(adenine-N6)-methyltransferase [Sedimentibacter hydroxybenzoicus]NYB73771.1 Dam family site-specific DNA-(adenine-N6)-methyltransferase [Sedimentibacter hydroxybenzoicus DSM 7310]